MAKLDAVGELAGLTLPDRRLEARARSVVGALQEDPAQHFPSAVGTTAAREGLYRLLGNVRVTLAALLAPHVSHTFDRILQQGDRPLVVIDKTSFTFGGEADRVDLERISPRKQGFDSLFALAVSPSRHPLGVLAVRPTASKGASSAIDWSGFVDCVHELAFQREISPIYVMDREADAYELFAACVEKQQDFVVRMSFDRKIVEDGSAVREPMRDVAARVTTSLTRTVHLSRRPSSGRSTSAREKHPSRESREALLSVRATPISLPRPKNIKSGSPELRLHLVQVLEENPPRDCVPVEWLLATTLPIDDTTNISTIVDVYRARWTIEEFFKTLKTGCNFEKRQLESRHTLENALGLLVPLAWRLLALRSIADEDPKAPAAELLEEDELVVLSKLSVEVKIGVTSTTAQVVAALARLGGHIPQNGRPGWLVIWRGFKKLLDRVEGYRLAKAEM